MTHRIAYWTKTARPRQQENAIAGKRNFWRGFLKRRSTKADSQDEFLREDVWRQEGDGSHDGRGDTEAARDWEHAYQEAGVPRGQDRGRAEYSSQECIQKQTRYVGGCRTPDFPDNRIIGRTLVWQVSGKKWLIVVFFVVAEAFQLISRHHR